MGGALAFLHRHSLGLGVPLLGRRHQRGIDDLPAHRQIAAFLQLPVKISEQCVERAGIGQTLAKRSDRVGIGRCCTKIKAQKSQPTQPVADQPFHARVRNVVLRCQHQHLEHDDRVIGRATALGSVRVSQRRHQRRTERFKVDNLAQNLKRITVGRQPFHVIR